jgi:thymidylate kinase
VFVALIGPDGAGKTTLASRLSEGVGELVFRGTALYHSRFNLMPRLRSLGRSASGLKLEETDFTKRHSGSKVKPHGVARCLLYLLYYIWDYQLGRLPLWLNRGRSRLILFDRYFYNYYYQKAYMNIPWAFLDIFRAAVPKPDIVLIMDADPSVIYERKPELDCPEIDRQLGAINKLADRLRGSVLKRVQAGQGLEIAEDQAIRAIVRCVAAKNQKNYRSGER